jgi:hypothetical protein
MARGSIVVSNDPPLSRLPLSTPAIHNLTSTANKAVEDAGTTAYENCPVIDQTDGKTTTPW